MSTKTRLFLATLLVSLPLDQLSKYWIIASFHYGERLEVIPGLFDLTHVRNPGGAFSFFAGGPPELRMIFFVGTTLLAIALLLVFFHRLEPQSRVSSSALGAILGGAIGNLIDRLVHREVIDFIDVHLWGGYTWPTFNLADSFIVVGVIILVIETFKQAPGDHPDPASREPQA
jgi:signal peptidase II